MWNQSGEHICQFYKNKEGKRIKFLERDQSSNFYSENYGQIYEICFVIDNTGSMKTDIAKARESVKKITKDDKF